MRKKLPLVQVGDTGEHAFDDTLI